MRAGLNVGLKDMMVRKSYLNQCIENEKYDGLEYFSFEKPGLYPFAVSSQMSPKVLPSNRGINNHTDPNEPFSCPMITFLPDKDSTFVIIAAFPDDEKAITGVVSTFRVNPPYKLFNTKMTYLLRI